METKISPKSYGVAVTLAMIFGTMGIHHFYLALWLHGLFDFSLFVVGFACILFVDDGVINGIGFSMLAVDLLHTIVVTYWLFVGKVRDGDGLLVAYPGQFETQRRST